MYILIDLDTKLSFAATGIKALSKVSGFNYHTITSYLRKTDLYISDKVIVSRINKIEKQKRYSQAFLKRNL